MITFKQHCTIILYEAILIVVLAVFLYFSFLYFSRSTSRVNLTRRAENNPALVWLYSTVLVVVFLTTNTNSRQRPVDVTKNL